MNNNLYVPSFSYLQKPILLFFMLAVVLVFGLTKEANAQKKITWAEFSRFPLMSRAAFFEKEILDASRAEGVDPYILWVIAYNETRFRPWLRSPKNAKGLMQFIPATAKRFNLKNPYEPIPSIRAAARYVKYLSRMFGGRIDSILAAYNSGEGTVSAYRNGRTLKTKRKIINRRGIRTIGGVPPYRETIHYVGQGLKVYRWLVRMQKFPRTSLRAEFPNTVSSRVARVFFSGSKIKRVPKRYKVEVRRTTNNSAKTEEIGDNQIKSAQKSNLDQDELKTVYYDPRTGSRYRIENGEKVKLSDSGIVFVNHNVSGEKTNKARSILFGQ